MATLYSPSIVMNGLVLCLDAANTRSYTSRGSYSFNGTSQYLTANTSTLALGTGDFCVEGWVYANNTQTAGIFQLSTSTTYFNNTSTAQISAKVGSGYIQFGTNAALDQGLNNTSSAYVPNTWYHVAMTRQSNAVKCFVNGQLIVGPLTDSTNYSGTYLNIGAAYTSTNILNGNIANFRITKGAALYVGNFTVPTSALTTSSSTTLFLPFENVSNPLLDKSVNNISVTATTTSSWAGINPFGQSGTTWTDLSGNRNNGTLTNGPTFISSNSGSIVFDGINDNIQLGNASTFISASQSQVTINSWIRTNVVGSYKKIFITGNAGVQSVTGLYLSLGPSSTYFGVITSGGQTDASTSQFISTTSYSNLCGTYDGTNIRLYLNGQLVGTTPLTGTIVNTGIARISGYDNNSETWDGNISIVQIYNRALSASEILQNFNALRGRYGI